MAPGTGDDWRPTASITTLRIRAQILARVREFFATREVLEVETAILSAAGTVDPQLHSLAVHSLAPSDTRSLGYLHTSPEFAMKRLLATGSGPIYQLCKVFRAGEHGRLHNPEFTLLEWYRPGFTYFELMDEVAALLAHTLGTTRSLQAPERLTYADAFRRYADVDPHRADAAELRAIAEARGLRVSGLSEGDRDGWRDLLLTHLVEPRLGSGRPTFLHDYPASAAALARTRNDDPPVAERFELYLDGIELANGFQELTDADEQRQRFEQDQERRRKKGLADVPYDQHLIAALVTGLPACSGVALGIDRLVMLATGARALEEVIAFPLARA